jgi:hypothetical protein
MMIAALRETPFPMMTKFFSLCTALLCAASLSAQDVAHVTITTEPIPDHGKVKCLMKSDASTWQTLGLTADKSQQAQAIADRCSKAHAMKDMDDKADKDATKDDRKDEMKDAHVQELKTLLTADEFNKWKEWCGAQGYIKDKDMSEKKY